MSDCLFCRIVAEELPSDRVAESDEVVAFRDIAPRAPVHVLVVPRRHIDSAHVMGPEDSDLLAASFAMIRTVAEQLGVADGYRVATNVGEGGGQTVPHLHFHVLGGRQLRHIDSGEPPNAGPSDASALP